MKNKITFLFDKKLALITNSFEYLLQKKQYMKTFQELFPQYFQPHSNPSFGQLLPITHKDKQQQERDLQTSMKHILEQIQNIKHDVQQDKFDSFIDKTMRISSQQQNSRNDFSKKSIKNQLTFTKSSKLRLKKKMATNLKLPNHQEATAEQKKINISCNNFSLNQPDLLIGSRTLDQGRVFSLQISEQPLKIQDFELGQCIGSGKFGDVYICKHRVSSWIFGLKKILKSTITSYNMISQFVNQLKIQYRLNHPNIIKLYAHFSDQYHIFLLMEYAPGGTLMSKLKCSQQYASNVLQQNLKAVKYLHNSHIIHRDIKPENIVIFFDGTFKLCDFGLSAFLSHRYGVKTSFCGTLDYIAPQMKDVGFYDYSVDIWGLGILTYQLLIGEAPFKDQINNWKKNGSNNKNGRSWKIQYPSQLSDNAIQFIRKFLKQNPNERTSIEKALTSKFIKQGSKKVVNLTEKQQFFLQN